MANPESRDFTLKADEISPHPGARIPAKALASLFRDNMIAPEHCREALRRELILSESNGDSGRGLSICVNDGAYEFRDVQKRFRLIDSDTVTVVVDCNLVERLRAGYPVSPKELQEFSVQIWTSRLQHEPVIPIVGKIQLYAWEGGYDDFLGYLAEAGANPKRS